jgi:SAM-dependent methyltransferase
VNVSERDEIAEVIEEYWERMAREGCGFTRPWLDLDRDLVRRYARGEAPSAPEPLDEMYPAGVLKDVEGRDVLCLASGGGQQSAVFGLLGARVTVVDLSESQLDADRRAAEHYGHQVATVRADMRDLSALEGESFDLVYQAPSMAFVPDVRRVYGEVRRLLKPGGAYRVEYTNPAVEFVDLDGWDGEGYRITVPYAEMVRRRDDGVTEFRHHLSDIFNGLIEAGLSIRRVEEGPHYRRAGADARPGSWEHWLTYSAAFAVVAEAAG